MPWPEEIRKRFPLLKRLSPRGVYAVGGIVRDLLVGIEPNDADLACADALACARSLGRKVITLGKDHLSAYRIVDGEHVYDFAPLLGGDIRIDLARRDFTVNAMAVDLERGELLDPFDGRGDLERRLVRMVDAKNFDDDPLRMLKGVRMVVKYRYAFDGDTLEAIRERAASIASVAVERVTAELEMIFSAGQFRHALALLRDTGLDAPLFGFEVNAAGYHADDVSLAGAYALLFRDPHPFPWCVPLLREITTLQRLAGDPSLFALYDAGETLARQLPPMLRALGRDPNVAMPDFATTSLLTGNEIAALLDEKPGPRVGQLKRALLEAQLRGEVTTREEAERFVTPST
jgi:tRNA nucleotidyltransferase/poly(A) polymerase